MNTEKLKAAESAFLSAYPLGFNTPELKEIVKKHSMVKITAFAKESFSPEALEDPEQAAADFVRLMGRSTIVSVFEKAKFRDTVRGMTAGEREDLMGFVRELLHGSESMGFDGLCGMLSRYGADKWPVVTAMRCYYYPDTDLVIKPTTVKNAIAYFGLEGLVYTPRPAFAFYEKYRAAISGMRGITSPLCGPTGAHFSGFLMMAMEGELP